MDQNVWSYEKDLKSHVPLAKRDLLLHDWPLSGHSKSALRTGFKMGPFHLDAGHSVFGRWNTVLISHGHADHIFSFASFFLVGSKVLDGTQTVFAPNTKLVRAIADATLQSNYDTQRFHVSAKFIDAAPGDVHEVLIGKERYRVRILKMDHSVPTVGYCVDKWTTRMNPLLIPIKERLSARDFGLLMKALRSGSEVPPHLRAVVDSCALPDKDHITVDLCLPQFCFLTDTSINGIIWNIDVIKEYPIIIVECTFYHKDDIEHARDKQHIHWIHLESFIRIYSESLWVLIHSSSRYKTRDDVLESIQSNHNDDKPALLYSNSMIWLPTVGAHD
jgi:ribonuclease Z